MTIEIITKEIAKLRIVT